MNLEIHLPQAAKRRTDRPSSVAKLGIRPSTTQNGLTACGDLDVSKSSRYYNHIEAAHGSSSLFLPQRRTLIVRPGEISVTLLFKCLVRFTLKAQLSISGLIIQVINVMVVDANKDVQKPVYKAPYFGNRSCR